MKLAFILLSLLLTIALVSAGYGHLPKDNHYDGYQQVEDYSYHPYQCGPSHKCKLGEVCHRVRDVCMCLPIPEYKDICLSIKQIGVWQDGSRGGQTYSQYEVTIENHSDRNIKEIFIGTDYTFKLRDSSPASLWNMDLLPKGILTLPNYQNSINAHASYTFGFIVCGASQPNLHILNVKFE